MPNTILLKRASTAGKVPVTANLSLGELSVNSTDGRLYTTTGAAIVDLTQNDKITLSGDATGTSTNPAAGSNYSNLAVTLSSTGVTAGNYGSATSIPTIVVDAKGRVTSLTTNAVSTTISLAGSSGSGSVSGGGTLTLNGSNGIATSVAGSTITISASGTVPTANVSLHESVTASTTNATFYPMLSDKTDGNTASFSASTLTYNPSTGALSATSFSGTSATLAGTVIASVVQAGTIGNAGATLTGTLSTVAQPNITSVGTLSSLTTTGDVTVGGNLTIQGNTVTIGSNNLTVTDSIIGLHTFANGAPLLSDDGRDIGVRFHYYKGADKHAFLGWENGTETLVYFSNATEVNSNVTGTLGNVQFGSLTLSNTAATVLTVGGNTAINSSLYAQSVYDSSNRVVSTSSGAGNLSISAGAISLAATGPGAGTVGSANYIPVITTDAYGRVTTLANTAISLPFASLTATPTTLTGYGITDALSTSATIDGGTY